MGFTEVLTIVFVVLKLIGTIDWSWWLVLLPEIIATAFYIFYIIMYFVMVVRISKQQKKLWRRWDE